MRLQFLNHLLNSVSALAQPQRIVVLGSSSLLPAEAQEDAEVSQRPSLRLPACFAALSPKFVAFGEDFRKAHEPQRREERRGGRQECFSAFFASLRFSQLYLVIVTPPRYASAFDVLGKPPLVTAPPDGRYAVAQKIRMMVWAVRMRSSIVVG